jgi:hypothetical protein
MPWSLTMHSPREAQPTTGRLDRRGRLGRQPLRIVVDGASQIIAPELQLAVEMDLVSGCRFEHGWTRRFGRPSGRRTAERRHSPFGSLPRRLFWRRLCTRLWSVNQGSEEGRAYPNDLLVGLRLLGLTVAALLVALAHHRSPYCHSAARYPLTGRGGWHPAVPAHQIDAARHSCARDKCAQAHAAQHSTPIECQGGAAASTSGLLTPATRRIGRSPARAALRQMSQTAADGPAVRRRPGPGW